MDLRTRGVLLRMSQHELCSRSCTHQSYLTLWERGLRMPGEAQKERLARALNCEVGEIDWDAPRKRLENEVAKS